MKKWTKKDIKTLCQTISTFWLVNRPLGDSADERLRALSEVRQYLAGHRAEVVCAGIAQLGDLAIERARSDQEAADHFRNHPEVYGESTPEMIERFEGLARESRKDAARAEQLIARVRADGLPPEVMTFDPLGSQA